MAPRSTALLMLATLSAFTGCEGAPAPAAAALPPGAPHSTAAPPAGIGGVSTGYDRLTGCGVRTGCEGAPAPAAAALPPGAPHSTAAPPAGIGSVSTGYDRMTGCGVPTGCEGAPAPAAAALAAPAPEPAPQGTAQGGVQGGAQVPPGAPHSTAAPPAGIGGVRRFSQYSRGRGYRDWRTRGDPTLINSLWRSRQPLGIRKQLGNAEVYIVLALLIGFVTVVVGCWLSDNCWSPEPEELLGG